MVETKNNNENKQQFKYDKDSDVVKLVVIDDLNKLGHSFSNQSFHTKSDKNSFIRLDSPNGMSFLDNSKKPNNSNNFEIKDFPIGDYEANSIIRQPSSKIKINEKEVGSNDQSKLKFSKLKFSLSSITDTDTDNNIKSK